jgi:hypothetical protein
VMPPAVSSEWSVMAAFRCRRQCPAAGLWLLPNLPCCRD